MNKCKNCGSEVKELYCGHCGQLAVLERITFYYIWHGIVHFFTHAERGFLFTSWQMLVAPGKMVTNFIAGKRKKYQPPVSYYLIWIGIYILALYMIEKFFGQEKVISFGSYFGPNEQTKYAISHLNIVLTALLPIQALYVYLVLVKKLYNYFETLVTIIYCIGTVLMLQFVFAVVAIPFYMVSGDAIKIQISDILKILYIGWFMFDFAQRLPIKHKFIRAMVVMILAFGTFTAWRLLVFPTIAKMFF
jgi:hypothetical protein